MGTTDTCNGHSLKVSHNTYACMLERVLCLAHSISEEVDEGDWAPVVAHDVGHVFPCRSHRLHARLGGGHG